MGNSKSIPLTPVVAAGLSVGDESRCDSMPMLFTVGEVAALLRTSAKAVYAMVERRQLPGVTRVGRRVLVRSDQLLNWLHQKRTPSLEG
jgi:excisionase family DNA binding protein